VGSARVLMRAFCVKCDQEMIPWVSETFWSRRYRATMGLGSSSFARRVYVKSSTFWMFLTAGSARTI
jgi:hypothetical protein